MHLWPLRDDLLALNPIKGPEEFALVMLNFFWPLKFAANV